MAKRPVADLANIFYVGMAEVKLGSVFLENRLFTEAFVFNIEFYWKFLPPNKFGVWLLEKSPNTGLTDSFFYGYCFSTLEFVVARFPNSPAVGLGADVY